MDYQFEQLKTVRLDRCKHPDDIIDLTTGRYRMPLLQEIKLNKQNKQNVENLKYFYENNPECSPFDI